MKLHPIPFVLFLVSLVSGAVRSAAAQVSVAWSEPTAGVMVAVDGADSVFTATTVQAPGAELIVTARDASGALLWTASQDQSDPTKWEQATWVGTDSLGNVLVSGTLMSGISNPVEAASLLLKFAPDGSPVYRIVYETAFDGSFTRKLLIGPDDSVFVLGMGSGPSGYVSKIARFAPDGSRTWTWFDAAGIGRPVNFKFASNGDLVVVGRAQFGSLNGYARVGADGQTRWSLVGVPSLTSGDAASDALGNTYVVHGTWGVGGGTAVKKLDPSGAVLWEAIHPSSGFRVEVGWDDRPVVAGFPSPSTAGAAFFKLETDGSLLWSNPDADGPLGLLLHSQLVLDASGDAYLSAGTLFEMAVCKVRSDGASAWTATTPGGYARGLALGRTSSAVYVVGGQTARLDDATEGFWSDLGAPLPGAAGPPVLQGSGLLAFGEPLLLTVTDAPPLAPGAWVLGGAAQPLPLLGGTLVPTPSVVLPLATDALGRAHLAGALASPVPTGVQLVAQAWFADPTGPVGFTASGARTTSAP